MAAKEHVLLIHIEDAALRERSPITRGALKLKQYAVIVRKIANFPRNFLIKNSFEQISKRGIEYEESVE